MPEAPLVYTPLAAATIRVLEKLALAHDWQHARDAEGMNVVAVALSALITIYTRETGSRDVRAISEAELVAGRFSDGAARLVFDDGRQDLDALLVKDAEIHGAIETISASFVGRRYIEDRETPRRTD